MRRVLALLLALASTSGAAQTCGGFLTLPLAETPWSVAALAVQAPGGRGLAPEAVGRPSPDSLIASGLEAVRDTMPARYGGLFMPRDALRTWTRCGYSLLRYEITAPNADSAMTLDLYNVPAHVPLAPEAPLSIRPGRWSFDFRDGVPLSDGALRRED